MHHPARAALMLAAFLATVASAAGRPGLEGRWRLVAQHRGGGQADLLGGGSPLWLEFVPEGTQLACRIRTVGAASPAVSWPASPPEAAARALTIERRHIDAAAGTARARYTVPLALADGEALRVVEDYALSEDGGTLAGTVTVTLLRHGQEAGSYTLTRRFAREP